MSEIYRATTDDGMVKMAVIDGTDIVAEASRIHKPTPVCAAALGRLLCGASLLGDMMKEENGTLTIRVNGGGPTGTVFAVSDSSGNVRGFMENANVDLPLRSDGKLDVGGAVGKDGLFTVSKDIGLKEPYIGSVELVTGEIAEDLTSYLLSSEQTASACALGVLVGNDNSILAAGGFIVQLMPGAEDDIISKLEDNIFLMDQLTTIIHEDGIQAVFAQVLKGLPYHIVSQSEVSYKCYCSRERILEALTSLDRQSIDELCEADEPLSVSCQFCDKVYTFLPDEIKKEF